MMGLAYPARPVRDEHTVERGRVWVLIATVGRSAAAEHTHFVNGFVSVQIDQILEVMDFVAGSGGRKTKVVLVESD